VHKIQQGMAANGYTLKRTKKYNNYATTATSIMLWCYQAKNDDKTNGLMNPSNFFTLSEVS